MTTAKLDLDTMNSQDKEAAVYKMRRELEQASKLASENPSFFTTYNPTQAQYSIWRRNMYVPLADQLREQAERKLQEQEEA